MTKYTIILQIKRPGEWTLPAKGHADLGLSFSGVSSAQHGASALTNECVPRACTHRHGFYSLSGATISGMRPHSYSRGGSYQNCKGKKIPTRSQEPTTILFCHILRTFLSALKISGF